MNTLEEIKDFIEKEIEVWTMQYDIAGSDDIRKLLIIHGRIDELKRIKEKLNDLVQVKQDVGSITYTMSSKLAKASMELLINSDLKMKNKKLQEKIKEQQKQLNIANKKILSQKGQLKVVNTSYIPKSKVREKIEEYEELVKDFEEYWSKDPRQFKKEKCVDYYKIEALKELLQEGEINDNIRN
mgnify:CR=1 FL=1